MSTNLLLVLLAGLIVIGSAVAVVVMRNQKSSAQSENAEQVAPPPEAPVEREPDAIYQKNRLTARVLEPEVDEANKQIYFGEIYNSEYLLLADEAEFGKYIILVKKIAHASKMEPGNLHRGRVLKGVQAQIVGYRAQ